MNVSARRFSLAAFAAVLAATLVAPPGARAAETPSTGIGVARLSVVDGEVNVQRGDSNGFTSAAVINTPVLGADYVTTGDNAHAELQFDGTTMVRLNSGVQLRLTHVDAKSREMQLAVGTIELRLLRGTDGNSTIDTPSISIRPKQSGRYRVTVTPEGETDLTVREGSVAVETPQGAQTIGADTTLIATGSADAPTTSVREAIALDDFDRFNGERDRVQSRALASASYVNRDIDGVEDLDRYGRWVDDSSYGHVWIPANTAANWSPYRDGRWVWEDGYGWTWIAAEPWGWAPYHYGRWYHSPAYGWAWYPPARSYAPVYSPALVAFLSFGNVSVGFGDIGWVPLAPYEPYYPFGYGWGRTTIVNNVTNITNVTNVTNVTNGTPTTPATITPTTGNYRNVLVHNAVVGVSVKQFQQGRFEHPVAILGDQLRRAIVVHGTMPIVPTTENLRYSARAVSPQVSTRPAFSGTFAGTTVPVARVPFEQQRRHIATIVAGIAPTTASATQPFATRRAALAPGAGVPAATDPWTRFNTSRGTPTSTTHRGASANAAPATSQSESGYAAPRRAPSVDTAPRESHATRYPASSAPSYDRATRAAHETVPAHESVPREHAPESRPPARESAPVRHVDRKAEPTRKPGT